MTDRQGSRDRRTRFDVEFHAMADLLYLVRDLVDEAFGLWEVRREDTYLAKTVATELATNAVRATPNAVIKVRITIEAPTSSALIEVWDSSWQLPTVQDPDLLSERGRGLVLVRELCKGRLGWHWATGPYGGKVVWARISGLSAVREQPKMTRLTTPLRRIVNGSVAGPCSDAACHGRGVVVDCVTGRF